MIQHAEDSAADYSFPHEQVQEFALGTLLPERRRAIHAAIVAMLVSGEPAPESLPLLAHHAKAAGDAPICVRFSVEASRNALAANAPEEVLRLVDVALPLAATPQERVDLLESRDRALDMLRRPDDRMQGLAELAALAEAMADSRLELDVRLRRAAALRMNEECDRAAQLAREVMELAASRDDQESELAACIELGQDLVRATAGETFTPAAREVDLDGAEEAYQRALTLARARGDEAATALVLRELGVSPSDGFAPGSSTRSRPASTSRSRCGWRPASPSMRSSRSSRSRPRPRRAVASSRRRSRSSSGSAIVAELCRRSSRWAT